ncbi:MAG: PEP-CTERM sorting domain-containing protein [Gammaproteobacteria bacterium]|nr:MAG: PEP-CTERM sorting domain-containing protein [Gammaproteobacteria bacterium]
MKIKLRLILVANIIIASLTGIYANAGTILITEFDYGPYAYTTMKSNLEAAGHTVNIVNAKIAGNLATALGSGIYDSLFLYDLTSNSYLNLADRTAVAGFYGVHDSIVIDSRSYGYYFQGNNASEVKLLQNIAAEFDSRNGGVWFGTDHDPDWTKNVNPILSLMGFDTVAGSHSQAVNSWDPASVLLSGVTPTDLWGSGASVGHVSLGIQPNGVDMRFHFGHSSGTYGAIPYISASFGNFIAPDEDPSDHASVPEPTTIILLGIGIANMGFSRRNTRQR